MKPEQVVGGVSAAAGSITSSSATIAQLARGSARVATSSRISARDDGRVPVRHARKRWTRRK
jgi:hypothetical protein